MAVPAWDFFRRIFSKKRPSQNYLVLKVDENQLAGASWKVSDGKVVVGKLTSAAVSVNSPEFLTGVDQVVSQCLVAEDSGPQEVIFGINQDWVEEGKLKQPYLGALKKVCRELNLKPLGFVSYPEAVENYLRATEGVPPTAILVGVAGSVLTVTLIRAGKNFGTVEVDIDGQEGEVLEKGIRKFSFGEFLPSRIVIYDGQALLERWKEKLTSYPWTQRLPFLHFPKIEIFSEGDIVRAVAVAGGMQMGGSLVVSDIVLEEGRKTSDLELMPEEAVPEERDDKEVSLDGEISPATAPNIARPTNFEEVSPQELGFFERKNKIDFRAFLTGFFPQPRPSFSWWRKGVLLGLPVLIIAVVLLIGGLGFYSLARAKVIVYVISRDLSKTLDMTVVLDQPTGGAGGQLPGKIVQADLSTTKRSVTTGKKLVGDPAKGKVTIYGVGPAKIFPAGTTIVLEELKFSLDSQMEVASADASTPATAVVAVTANDIGAKYNLSAGTKFTIADLPPATYVAKNESSFTGGNSREANVVTKDDQNRLLASASAELSGKAGEQLRAGLLPQESLLDQAITAKEAKRLYSHKVDEVADSVSLELTMTFSGVVFNQNDAVASYIQALTVAGEVPAEYELSPSRVSVQLVGVKQTKSGEPVLTLAFSGKMLPLLDTAQLGKTLVGKGREEAVKTLRAIAGVKSVEFLVQPSFFSSVPILPLQPSRFAFEIVEK